MSYIAGLLTCILILNGLLLVLLVLVQLPKKDAGAGLAFGGGTADALFGAGSGNALTKITKWGTVIFIVLALFLGYFQDNLHRNDSNTMDFLNKVNQKASQAPAPQAYTNPQSTAPAAPSKNPIANISLSGSTGSNAAPVAPVTAPAK